MTEDGVVVGERSYTTTFLVWRPVAREYTHTRLNLTAAALGVDSCLLACVDL